MQNLKYEISKYCCFVFAERYDLLDSVSVRLNAHEYAYICRRPVFAIRPFFEELI